MSRISILTAARPIDQFNGADLRLQRLCGFADDVYYLQDKTHSASGLPIATPLPWLNAVQIESLESVVAAAHDYQNRLWIACDFASFRALSHLGVCKLIYDGCDCQSLYFERRFRHLPWTWLKKRANALRMTLCWRRREREIVARAAAVVVPAEADRQAFRYSGAKGACVAAISNGTDWVDRPTIQWSRDAKAIQFHGAYSWPVNRTTAIYLASRLFPNVLRRVPEATLRLAGHPVFEELKNASQTPGIFLDGHVADIRSWLGQCGVYVMPMFQGGGVKNKLLEAMAGGLPIVTNTLGAEALSDEARTCLLVADDHDALVDAVVQLLEDRDRAEDLGRRARQYATEHFSWEAASDQYRALIDSIDDGLCPQDDVANASPLEATQG